MRKPVLSLLFALALAAGCGEDDSSSRPTYYAGPTTGGSSCVAGQQIACACAGTSVMGVQTCEAGGTGFGACLGCPGGQPAGGAAGAGGGPTGGAAGSPAGPGGSGGSPTGGSGGSPVGPGGSGPGGSGPGGSGPGGSGQGGSGPACSPVTAERAPASVLLLLDRSGSMGDASKFPAMVDVLPAALTQAPQTTPVGLLRFPEGAFDDNKLSGCLLQSTPECQALIADGGCTDVAMAPQAAIGPLLSTLTSIQQALNTQPTGSSPLRAALSRARQILSASPSDGTRAVLLLTDTNPPSTHQPASPPLLPSDQNVPCGELSDILAETSAALASPAPVRTVVMAQDDGMGDLAFTGQLAQAGGTHVPGCAGDGCFHKAAAGSSSSVKAAITAALNDAIGCRFRASGLSPAQLEGAQIAAVTGGQSVPIPRDPTHTAGYDLDAEGAIELYGVTCSGLPADAKIIATPACGP